MSTTKRFSRGFLCASVFAMFGAVGCGGPSYERTDISDVSQGDLSTTISLQTISMPVGAATKAVIRPYDDEGALMASDVTSESPTTLDIAPGVGEAEYIFIARAVGTTNVRFVAGGSVVAVTRVEITPQSAAP